MFSFMNTQDITNALRDVWYESYRTNPIVQLMMIGYLVYPSSMALL